MATKSETSNHPLTEVGARRCYRILTKKSSKAEWLPLLEPSSSEEHPSLPSPPIRVDLFCREANEHKLDSTAF